MREEKRKNEYEISWKCPKREENIIDKLVWMHATLRCILYCKIITVFLRGAHVTDANEMFEHGVFPYMIDMQNRFLLLSFLFCDKNMNLRCFSRELIVQFFDIRMNFAGLTLDLENKHFHRTCSSIDTRNNSNTFLFLLHV